MKLRPGQLQFKSDIENAWENGHKNVLGVYPTGGGKTVVFSNIVSEHNGPNCVIAHRQELVLQISIALARECVIHKIIGPKNVVKLAVKSHMQELGKSFYNPNAHCGVAGVDTLIRRKDSLRDWANSVTMWVQDEAHHVLTQNKWGSVVEMFPNALGLGVTATPRRADGMGLGASYDGVFHEMVEGPQMRDLINQGYLTDYRVIVPPSDLDLSNVNKTASGEFSPKPLDDAVQKSHIIGDVVKHYLKFAKGKRGVTFATSVATATQIAKEYNDAGVPAMVVSAKSTDLERTLAVEKLKSGELLQLVNVDLFGEGFDLPAIEVVSMARPTMSYSLYVQQFGRALRLMLSKILMGVWDTYTINQRLQFIAESVKPKAVIIDHVGNILRHSLPDVPQIWTLDRHFKTTKTTNDEIPLRVCINPECAAAYESVNNKCPFCGKKPEPTNRNEPEFVDGDLLELDEETLKLMRQNVAEIDKDKELARQDAKNKFMPRVGEYAHVKRHVERKKTQDALRKSIAWWGGYQKSFNRSESESYRRFYFKFGIDVLSAQALNTKDALVLAEKINDHLGDLANEFS